MKKNLVVLTGAGISAESGLQTFRDGDGLWENHKIEDVATPEAWYHNASLVQDFYNYRRKNVLNAQPNKAHKVLADLEEHFNVQIITQNIDDLHERAGSSNVLHLHGEILKMRCEFHEEAVFDIYEDISLEDKAPCGCGGRLRPYIVWFGEAVPMMDRAINITTQADIFVVIGTSLMVYPAAGLVQYTPHGLPVYILDKKIPHVNIKQVVRIEQSAVNGIDDLFEMLSLQA